MASYGAQLWDKDGNKVYPSPYWPVGSIFLSMNNINPSVYFGGTWERLTGAYLYAAAADSPSSSTYTGTNTQSTALNANQIPAHNHYFRGDGQGMVNVKAGWVTNFDLVTINGAGTGGYRLEFASTTQNTGGGQGHTHNVSYIAVIVWQRTA